MTLMVTGHRQVLPMNHTGSPYPEYNWRVKGHHADVINVMTLVIRQHVNTDNPPPNFITGMAIGTDQLFASAVIGMQDELKRNGIDYPIGLIAAVPFKGQETKWPKNSQEIYHTLLARATHIEYVCSPGYAPWKMQRRNEWMVNHSDHVLAVWNGMQSGGTFSCLRYALQQHKNIIRLDPQTLQISNNAIM